MSKPKKPKELNPTKWAAIMMLDDIMETVTHQSASFDAHAERPGACPAVENYVEEFDAVIDAVQKTFDVLAEHAEPLVNEIVTALEQFRHAKLTAIANCSKVSCPDRENAQRDLGWTMKLTGDEGPKPILQ